MSKALKKKQAKRERLRAAVQSKVAAKASSQQSPRKAGHISKANATKKSSEPAKPPVIRIPTPQKTQEIQVYQSNYPSSPDYENRQTMESGLRERAIGGIDYCSQSKSKSEIVEDVDYPSDTSESGGRRHGSNENRDCNNPSYFTFENETLTYEDDIPDSPRNSEARFLNFDPTGRSPLTSPLNARDRDVAYDYRDDEIPFVPTDACRDSDPHNMRRVISLVSLATAGTIRVPIFKAHDAESRLFDPTLGYNVELRHAFEFPEDFRAEHVAVHLGTMLERGRGNPRRDEMAAGVKAALRTTFGEKFPMNRQKRTRKEKLLLKVYVVDVSEGDRESRMFAPDCEIGLVRLCLAWIACTPDGSIVFDGGRVGMTDGLGMGVLDALHLTTGLSVLTTKLAPRLAKRIIDRLNLKSESSFFGLW